jgi:hypothetical protein
MLRTLTLNPVKLVTTTRSCMTSCTPQVEAICLIWSVNDVGYNAPNTKQIPAIFSSRMNTEFNSDYIIRKGGIQLFPYYINLIPIHSSNIWRNKCHLSISVIQLVEFTCAVPNNSKFRDCFRWTLTEMWNYQANTPLLPSQGILIAHQFSKEGHRGVWQNFVIHCLTNRKHLILNVSSKY